MFSLQKISYVFPDNEKLFEDISFTVNKNEKIGLIGNNGIGKSTLLKTQKGEIYRAENKYIYIDQEYSLIDNKFNIYEQAEEFNALNLEEHEIKIRLNRFLFDRETWNKSCASLSGGERMRLLLCCLSIYNQAPDVIVLDEPVNNLDIQSLEILTQAINEYDGTLIVVSHDETFLEQIKIDRVIKI